MAMKMIFTVSTIGLIMMGCSRHEEVHNVEKRGLPAQTQTLSDAEIGKMISKAAARRRWTCGPVESNRMVCTQERLNPSLKIQIDFSKSDFSITQLTNTAGGSEQTIHRRYNKWIKNLEKTIMDLFIKHNLKAQTK